ncbi:hypothetical protein ACFL4G_02585 [Thermodesulfobacteriota bacterium]
MKIRISIWTFLMFFGLYNFCFAVDVAYIDISPEGSTVWKVLEVTSEFYGLDIGRLYIGDGKERHNMEGRPMSPDVRAIVISGKALTRYTMKDVILDLHENDIKKIPLLVYGLDSQMDPKILNNFFESSVVECKALDEATQKASYEIADMENVARQLAGQKFPISFKKMNYLEFNRSQGVESIVHVGTSNKESLYPVFVKTSIDGQEVFLLTKNQFADSSSKAARRIDIERFLEMAPLMMFLRYSCKERCWHSPAPYANLTIDDPWLIESYGALDFKKLKKEMEKANFHTTIAFVPWNYDRSEPDIVELFQAHPDKFSICIHGNNHDHQEFYKYKSGIQDPMPAKPFHAQESDITQAIARMEEFSRLTGLPYDPVMVFPHGIAPANTLGLLKKYNFLATTNASNVPLGSNRPDDTLFWLRSVTLNFENFASLDRYPQGAITVADIAIDMFLGNPILIYGHQNMFADDINRFNGLAELINHIEPDIQWQNLGYIIQHLYLKRIRHDGNYDVRSFSRSIELENTQLRDVEYYFRKKESFLPQVCKVTVDGVLSNYHKSNDDLSLAITVPPGESRLIEIEYRNDLDLASIELTKDDLRIYLLRRLSDFRDNTLSKSTLGRIFINEYYEANPYKLGLILIGFIVMLIVVGVILWYTRKGFGRH